MDESNIPCLTVRESETDPTGSELTIVRQWVAVASVSLATVSTSPSVAQEAMTVQKKDEPRVRVAGSRAAGTRRHAVRAGRTVRATLRPNFDYR